VTLWVVFAGEPHHGWFHHHVMAWTHDIHVSGLVTDMLTYVPVLAFGAGLMFGFSFDTTGPIARRRAAVAPAAAPGPVDRRATDEPVTAERDAQPTTTGTQDGSRTETRTRTTNRS